MESNPGPCVKKVNRIVGLAAATVFLSWNTAVGQSEQNNTNQEHQQGFVIFESEITSQSPAAYARYSIEARIALYAQENGLPQGEGNLNFRNFEMSLRQAPFEPVFQFGAVGRMGVSGKVSAPDDELFLGIRQIPEVAMLIPVPEIGQQFRMPMSVPFYYAPMVLAHRGVVDGEKTLVTDGVCPWLESSPGASSTRQPSGPQTMGVTGGGLPIPSGMGMFPGNPMAMGSQFAMPPGSTINPFCLAIDDWTRLDPGTDPSKQTWAREFARTLPSSEGQLTERTRIVATTCSPYGTDLNGGANPWSDEEFLLDPVRYPVLYFSKEQLRDNQGAQQGLWDAAKDGVVDQTAFGQQMLQQAGSSGTAISIPKRGTKEAFVDGVIAKMDRNEYDIVGQMDDAIRGRFNLEDGEAVMRVSQLIAAQQNYPVKVDAIETPRRLTEQLLCPCGFGYGYPRYHIIVRSSPEGLTHEWQIGTDAVSLVYETEGIRVPPEMQRDVDEGMIKSDLHDIEYDIFRACIKKGKLSGNEEQGERDFERLGLKDFGKRLDKVSSAADCLGMEYADLRTDIAQMHEEAAPLLQRVIDEFGYENVKQACYH